MEKLKKFLTIFCVMCMSLSLAAPSFAAEIQPRYVGTQQFHYYSYSKLGPGTNQTPQPWKLLYTGHPATRDDERDTVETSVSYSHSFTGSITVELSKRISADFGISFGKEVSFAVSKQSGALAKGEYIKAFYRPTFLVTPVSIIHQINTVGFEQPAPGESYVPVNRWEVADTSRGSVNEAIMPQIRLEYWKDSKLQRANVPTRVEYYTYINGEYQLTSEE